MIRPEASSRLKPVDVETFETELGIVLIKRRKGRRRLSIILHPLRPIEVRSNLKTSNLQITEFLLQKRDWIERNQNKFQALKVSHPEKKFQEGEAFPVLGKNRQLKFIQSPDRKLRGWVQGEQIIFSVPKASLEEKHFRQTLRDLYKKISISYLSQRVTALSQRMQSLPSELSFGEAKNLWGSCHRSGHVRLNWKLIVFEPAIIDYVVIHELAHLKHLDHSQRFWNFVEIYEPNFREVRKRLKESEFQVAFLDKSRLNHKIPAGL